MTPVVLPEKPTADPELARLAKEDAAAWASYGEAVDGRLSVRLRRARFGLALATLKRLSAYEMTRNGTKVIDGAD